jgi:hypothetical protein
LQVRATLSGDQQTVQLTEQPSGLFILSPGYPAVMTDQGPTRLNVLEGKSPRDTLTARYVDPTDPTDVSTARVLMIQNVTGTIRIENGISTSVDTVNVNDVLFAHVLGETDRDFSAARDSIKVSFFNTVTTDLEDLMLYEVLNNVSQVYDTGEFRSLVGIPLATGSGGLNNDGRLRVNGGEQVRVTFTDLDNVVTQASVQVRSVTGDSSVRVLALNKSFDFIVAPNPYNARQHANDGLRLAAVANTGDVVVNRIEIYNLAGERVRLLDGAEIPFQRTISRGGIAISSRGNYWWNLRTDSGAQVASGTYWAKIYLRFTDSTTLRTQETTALRKFFIVH